MGVVVVDICLQQPICDDVMLICINLLIFIAVIITGQTIVGPSDYILRLVFFIFIRKPFEVFS